MATSSPEEFEKERNAERIQRYLQSPELLPAQKEKLAGFKAEFCDQRRQGLATQDSYLRYLFYLGRHFKKKYEKISKQDIQKYLEENKDKGESWQDWAKLSIKVFYRWLLTGRTEKGSPFPESVAWLKVNRNKLKKIRPEDCLTVDEFKKMLAACQNQRDRALLYLLFDTGARISEILNVQLKHVHLETDLPYLELPASKTDPRPVYLMDSIHELAAWLKIHPQRKDREAFLFPVIKTSQKVIFKPYLDRKVALYIVQRIAARAGIQRRIYSHLFRHSSATYDRKEGMPDQFMQLKYGWSENSRMQSRYAHIKPEDVANFQRKARGLPVKDDKVKTPRECPRCKAQNSWDSEFCKACATPLDPKARLKTFVEQVGTQEKIKEMEERQEAQRKEMDKLARRLAAVTVGKSKRGLKGRN
ncbi:MAG: tyrosine-type recombinase/integrase [Candidatus Micrarchaeota archaeon]|nr:tyrosine-type recombinase/integrase [Candidatus Micrarchaeota archaeon]